VSEWRFTANRGAAAIQNPEAGRLHDTCRVIESTCSAIFMWNLTVGLQEDGGFYWLWF
jgi:hypothetical protein